MMHHDHEARAGDMAAMPAPLSIERSDLLLALATLPLDEPAAYVRAMAETIRKALRVDHVDVLRCDPSGDALVSLGADTHGQKGDLARLSLREALPLAAVIQHGMPYLADDVQDDPAMPPLFARAGLHALLAVPLVVSGERVGVVYLASRRRDAFSREDQAFLSLVAVRVGLLIEHAELAQRRAELERERARQQARQEFLGIVSHELKTPVAVIRAYVEALLHRAERDGDGEGKRILERVEEQATRMLGLIDDLLDLQRLESGLLVLERSRVDLAELTQRVAEEIQATTGQHRIAVDAPEPMVVQADRRRIEQVLVNLMDNAVKYSPDGGDITVTVRKTARTDGAGWQAVLTVSDRGIGIAPADLPLVFNRFYQAAGGRLHRGVRGLGVGLYIAREIVERHGGTIWVESSEGQGSTFYLTLPLDALADDTL